MFDDSAARADNDVRAFDPIETSTQSTRKKSA